MHTRITGLFYIVYLANFSELIWVGIAALILLVIFFFSRSKKYKAAIDENAKEFDQLKLQLSQYEEKVEGMESILNTQETERKKIAKDLHDNIGTLMTAIKMKVLSLQKSEPKEVSKIALELDGLANDASIEVRRISHHLTPVSYDLTGLEGALEDLVYSLKIKGYEVDAELHNLDLFSNKEKGLTLYRIIQEIIYNIEKHSGGAFIKLETWEEDDLLHVVIRDNGKGIAAEKWNNEASKNGIQGMKSRVGFLKGHIEMSNSNGTEFKIEIPLS